MSNALEGIKVIDVSQVAAVPMCARHLADFGADVIHIENPATGDSWRVLQVGQGGNAGPASDIPYNWENYNRNKKSVTLDLSRDDGQKILHKMVEKADVFVTNLRLWEREKFRVEYSTLNQINPRIIYGSLTGYGKKGPDNNDPAYDTTAYWTRSALSYLLTAPGMSPPNFRAAFGDNVAGLGMAFGIIMALFVRERTGVGQEVDISLLHAGIYQMGFDISAALATGKDYADYQIGRRQEDVEKKKRREELTGRIQEAMAPLRDFYRENAPNPLQGPYDTKDGRRIFFAGLHPDRFWPIFCRAIEREDLEHDPRFASIDARRENNTVLYHILKEAFLRRNLEDWKPRLKGIPFAPVQNLLEVINDPQTRANDVFVPVEHPTHGRIEVIANPVILSETPATIRKTAPEFSQHTEEVLLELGYSWEDIARFKELKIIA